MKALKCSNFTGTCPEVVQEDNSMNAISHMWSHLNRVHHDFVRGVSGYRYQELNEKMLEMFGE